MAINYTQNPFIMSTYGYGTPYYIRNNTSAVNRVRSRFIFAQTNMLYPGEDFTGQYGFRLNLTGEWTGGDISMSFDGNNISQSFTVDERTSCEALRTQFLNIDGVSFASPIQGFYPILSLLTYWSCYNDVAFPWFTIDLSESVGTLAESVSSSSHYIDDNSSEVVISGLYPGRGAGDWYDVLSYCEYSNGALNRLAKRTNYCYQEPPPN
jgi:hypothetical protein